MIPRYIVVTFFFIKNIAPIFGGINLEDISAPRCFEVEERLQELGIPVMHDDQHGTAMITSAGIINALEISGKKIEEMIDSGKTVAEISKETGLRKDLIRKIKKEKGKVED